MAAPPVVTRTVSSSGSSASITLSTLLVDGAATLLAVTAGAGALASAARTVASVTHNALPCALSGVGDDGVFVQGEVWTRLAPDAGTWDVVVAWTGSGQRMCGATLVNGVNQGGGAATLGTPIAAGDAGTTANTIDVPSDVDALVIAVTMTDEDAGITFGGTALWQVDGLVADVSGGAHWKPGAVGTVTMPVTQSIPGWGSVGVSMTSVEVSEPAPVFPFQVTQKVG